VLVTAEGPGRPETAGRPVRILVLGGGYVAIYLVRALRAAIRAGRVEVTVVCRDNYHFYHGFVGEMLAGRIAPDHVLGPVRRILDPARVFVAEVEAIDLEKRSVTTHRHLDGRRYELSYDHLVLGLGAVDNLSAYPGLAEHAFKLKTFADCFRLKAHIVTMFELAEIETDPAERRRLLTFFVAGGGFAGSEVAGELAEYVNVLMASEYPAIDPEESRVVLVHPGPHILPELYGSRSSQAKVRGFPKLVAYATEHMAKMGLEVMTSTRIEAVSPHEVSLSNGERVATRTIISAVGTKPSPLLSSLPIPLDDAGRVVVDRTFRVAGHDGLWAAGDNAAVPHHSGGTCPPIFLEAMHQGLRMGRNFERLLDGRPLRPHRYRQLGQGVSLGRHTVAGELKGIPLTGTFPWVLWKALALYYNPSWDRRVRILFDWAATNIVGREIVALRVPDADDFEITRSVFQPGEIIVTEGTVGHHVHVILNGEVELVAGSGAVLSVRGPGEHFGQEWMDTSALESARARTAVETVTLRTDQTRELRRLVGALRTVLAGDAEAGAS
jgi:NADH dehydrogenase